MATGALLSLLLLGIVSGTQPSKEANLLDLLHRVIACMDNALAYLHSVKAYLTVDGLLGVVVAKEQSATLLRMLTYVGHHRPWPTAVGSQFWQVEQHLKQINWRSSQVAMAIAFTIRQDPTYFKAVGGILHPSIWAKVECRLKKLNQSELHREHPSGYKHALNESQSDSCLSEVLNQCKMSQFCWDLLVETEYVEYPLAHQVLYLTVARAMNCLLPKSAQASARIEHKVGTLCGSMYRANLKFEREHYPADSQDLFMQNIAFCGQNAYQPFRERYQWLVEIMSWQSRSKGCFPIEWYKLAPLVNQSVGRLAKRRERVFQGGCSLHKTSMALASMSIYVQQLVIQWLSLQIGFDCDHLIN